MAKTDKRTQIYLSARQHREAMEYARRSGTSLAGVVREAIDRYLAQVGEEADWTDDPVLDLVGDLTLPPIEGDDLDEAIDASVYDEDRA